MRAEDFKIKKKMYRCKILSRVSLCTFYCHIFASISEEIRFWFKKNAICNAVLQVRHSLMLSCILSYIGAALFAIFEIRNRIESYRIKKHHWTPQISIHTAFWRWVSNSRQISYLEIKNGPKKAFVLFGRILNVSGFQIPAIFRCEFRQPFGFAAGKCRVVFQLVITISIEPRQNSAWQIERFLIDFPGVLSIEAKRFVEVAFENDIFEKEFGTLLDLGFWKIWEVQIQGRMVQILVVICIILGNHLPLKFPLG